MSRHRAWRSRVADLLCFTLLTSLSPLPLGAQAGSSARPGRVRVAVGKCTDDSGGAIAGVADQLEHALLGALADRKAFEVLGQTGEGHPERTISARVMATDVPTDALAPVRIRVVGELADALSGRLLFRAVVEGTGPGRPGQEAAARIERAVTDAADQIATRVAQFHNVRGMVISVEATEAVANLGSSDGLESGEVLDVLRDGRAIGRLRIDRVGIVTSSGQLTDVVPGFRVQADDQVRLASDLLAGAKAPLPERKKRHGATWLYAAAVVVVAGTIAALASSEGSHQDLGDGRIYVTAADPQIPADGVSNTTITASVRDAKGRPARNGTRVSFETTLGMIAPGRASVLDGLAKATLTSAPRPGTAEVIARVNELHASTQVVFAPTPGSVVPRHLRVRADPSSIPADGKSTSTITAIVTDEHHRPVPDGTLVSFATARGTITPAGVPTAGGLAQAVLRSSIHETTATVTVRAGELEHRTDVAFFSVRPAHLAVTVDPARIPANGLSTSTIIALVSDERNSAVPDGTLVTFTTTLGVIGPRSAATVAGVATATLHSGIEPGTAEITVQTGRLSQAATVELYVSVPTQLTVTANPTSIPADGLSTSVITALVSDGNNSPVADGCLVTFETSLGLLAPATAKTQNGVATATLHSGTTTGTATVTVLAGTLTQEVLVTFTPPPP